MKEYVDGVETFELPVGKKATASYAAASVAALTSGQRVVLKARGRWIYKAVNVSQLATRRLRDARIAGVEIGSSPYTTQDGRERMVSYIEITLEPGSGGGARKTVGPSGRRAPRRGLAPSNSK